jgi:chemotaxis protein CheX
MDAAHINPFIQGTQAVCSTICGEAPSLGKLNVKGKPYAPMPITIAVTLIGDIAGDVIFNMAEQDGCFIASRMMGGMPVAALDEMSQSAVSEMANMISGNVATLFAGKGVSVDISPPRFKLNAQASDFPSATGIDKIVSIPLNFQNGHIIMLDMLFT